MIKVLISCAGGFSSSALAQRLKNEIIEKKMDDKIQVEFLPFSIAVREFDGYDLIMVCPHQRYKIDEYNRKFVKNKIPIYVIPTRIYGIMSLDIIYPDARDIIAYFREHPQNPAHFPNEENPLKTMRMCAYSQLKHS